MNQEITGIITETGLLLTASEFTPDTFNVWKQVGVTAQRLPSEQQNEEPAPPPTRPSNPNDIMGRLTWIEYELDCQRSDISMHEDDLRATNETETEIIQKIDRNHQSVKQSLSNVRRRLHSVEQAIPKRPPLTPYPEPTTWISGDPSKYFKLDEVSGYGKPLVGDAQPVQHGGIVGETEAVISKTVLGAVKEALNTEPMTVVSVAEQEKFMAIRDIIRDLGHQVERHIRENGYWPYAVTDKVARNIAAILSKEQK